MKLILVGSVAKGREWLRVASRRRNVKVVAIVEDDAGFEEADLAGADAAIFASRPAVRGRQAIRALNAGLGVMIETPMAASVAEAAEVFAVARRVNKPVIIAKQSRFGWANGCLRDLVHQGRLGRLTHMSILDRRKSASENGWTTETDYIQLLDRGVDQFDGAMRLLGLSAVSLLSEARKAPWSIYRHGSTTQAMIEMEQAVHVHYFGSLTASHDKNETWLEGEKGVLWTDERIIWWRKRGWPRFIPLIVRGPRVSPDQTRRMLLEELKSALQNSRTLPHGVADTLRALAMLEAAIRSDRENRPVQVPDVTAPAP